MINLKEICLLCWAINYLGQSWATNKGYGRKLKSAPCDESETLEIVSEWDYRQPRTFLGPHEEQDAEWEKLLHLRDLQARPPRSVSQEELQVLYSDGLICWELAIALAGPGLPRRKRGLRRIRIKLLGVLVLVLVGLFDYWSWRHLAYGQLSLGLWVGFGMLALLSIPVTFFGLVVAAILLTS